MVKNKRGSVVNISSHISLIGKEMSCLQRLEGSVTALTEPALRYAKYNVRVNCISRHDPTDLNRHVFEEAPDPKKKLRDVIATIAGRLGTPMIVAYAAVYLVRMNRAGDGVALPLEGGYTQAKSKARHSQIRSDPVDIICLEKMDCRVALHCRLLALTFTSRYHLSCHCERIEAISWLTP